jgi:large subunit ribosomal protein L21
MYAIIETGSKQYIVNKGDVLDIELTGNKPEENIEFNKVLFIKNQDQVKVGRPYIDGAKVSGKVVSIGKSDKVICFKYKNKINYRRTKGHRQNFIRVKIEEITN